MLQIERGSTRLQSVENLPWKRLWTCLEWMSECMSSSYRLPDPKVKELCSFKMSVIVHQLTRHNIPEESNVHKKHKQVTSQKIPITHVCKLITQEHTSSCIELLITQSRVSNLTWNVNQCSRCQMCQRVEGNQNKFLSRVTWQQFSIQLPDRGSCGGVLVHALQYRNQLQLHMCWCCQPLDRVWDLITHGHCKRSE